MSNCKDVFCMQECKQINMPKPDFFLLPNQTLEHTSQTEQSWDSNQNINLAEKSKRENIQQNLNMPENIQTKYISVINCLKSKCAAPEFQHMLYDLHVHPFACDIQSLDVCNGAQVRGLEIPSYCNMYDYLSTNIYSSTMVLPILLFWD